MREPTAHELADNQRLAELEQNAARRVERQDLRRLCPINQVIDRTHLIDLMRQGPNSNRPLLLWRHFAAVGMRAEAYSPEDVAAALEIPVAKLNDITAPVSLWEPPLDIRKRFPLLYPETVEHHEQPERVPAHQREDYPFVNTSGYRVAAPIDPGPRRRTLGGGEPAGTPRT